MKSHLQTLDSWELPWTGHFERIINIHQSSCHQHYTLKKNHSPWYTMRQPRCYVTMTPYRQSAFINRYRIYLKDIIPRTYCSKIKGWENKEGGGYIFPKYKITQLLLWVIPKRQFLPLCNWSNMMKVLKLLPLLIHTKQPQTQIIWDYPVSTLTNSSKQPKYYSKWGRVRILLKIVNWTLKNTTRNGSCWSRPLSYRNW